MEDFDIEHDGTRRPRLKVIFLAIMFPFIMGGLLGSILHTTPIEELIKNTGGFAAVLGITTGATILIWLGGFYQANKSGSSFGMKVRTWSVVVIGGHILGIGLGYIYM